MEIIGYSERGAMNALFYWMAFKNDENGMKKFLELAGIENLNEFSNFKIYNEFSLSEFGEPDLVVVATRGSVNVVFFIEAKVTACQRFRISSALKEYEKENPDSSNLFYQLKQKKAFFEIKDYIPNHIEKVEEKIKTMMGPRKIGNNPIVRTFVDELKKCTEAEYIAIIPDVSCEDVSWKEKNPIDNLRIVYWEDLYRILGIQAGYIPFKETMEYNQGKDPKTKSKIIKSQILNIPITETE